MQCLCPFSFPSPSHQTSLVGNTTHGHGDESDDGTLSDFGGESDNMDFDGDDIY